MAEHDVEFDSFFTEYRRWLVKQAYALCGDSHEAEDLAQSVFVRVYRRWHTVERPGELRGYLKRVLNSVFVDSRRKAAAKREVLGGEVPERPADDRAEPGPAAVDDPVFRSLDLLPERQRQVIFLRFWADLDVAETSRVLGCTPGTVTSQTSRGLGRLRAFLAAGHSCRDPIVIFWSQCGRGSNAC